jgi:hypothetical protein
MEPQRGRQLVADLQAPACLDPGTAQRRPPAARIRHGVYRLFLLNISGILDAAHVLDGREARGGHGHACAQASQHRMKS